MIITATTEPFSKPAADRHVGVSSLALVSILIPAYKPEYFRECLTSALAQTWPNVEIIVSDDCPTDEIRQICVRYDGLVTYVRNPNPGTIGHNNICHLASRAKGVYLKYLFDDDVLHPFCVQYLVEAMEQHANQRPTLAFSPRMTIDQNNQKITVLDNFPTRRSRLLLHDPVVTIMAARLRNPIGEFTTVLFRRADIFASDGTMELMTVNGVLWLGLTDVALFIHLLSKGPAVVVGDVLSYFRVHGNSNSNQSINPEWFHAVADWKRVVDYAIAHRILSVVGRLGAYLRLIRLLRIWSREAPALREQFNGILHQIREDIGRGTLPIWAALPIRCLLPR